jgi:IPT/TIG domain
VPSVAAIVQLLEAAPTVASVGPGSGSTNGATSVTVSGTNFLPGASVQIGGIAATNAQVTSSTAITADTPAGAPGAVSVTVTNPDYQTSTLNNGYSYTIGQGIAFAQVGFSAIPKNGVSSVSPVYPLAQSAGDLNVVVVGWNDSTSTISSVTDSAGNTYALAAGPVVGTNLTQAIYYAKNIVASSSNTVTVQFNQGASYPDVRIFEYAGLDTSSPLDVSHGASGQSLTASSGSVTTTEAAELVLASDTVLSKTLSPGTGYVPVVLTNFFDLAEHQVTSKKGKFNPTANLIASTNWVMQVVTFKAPGQ